jgi:hypothetical protein
MYSIKTKQISQPLVVYTITIPKTDWNNKEWLGVKYKDMSIMELLGIIDDESGYKWCFDDVQWQYDPQKNLIYILDGGMTTNPPIYAIKISNLETEEVSKRRDYR